MPVYTPDQYQHDRRRPHSFTVYGDAPVFHLPQPLAGKRVLDAGCGNGFWSDQIRARGAAEVVGIDGSSSGIEIARATYPGIRFEQQLLTETVLQELRCEPFDAVIAVEVIEHVFDPRGFVHACRSALKPGGTIVLTTPYHGYLKNLAMAVVDKWDFHHNPLWDGGHVKFWSRATLSALLTECGFVDLRFEGRSRVPYMWMGMIMSARKK
jgi:2-polyprenyl-3-methyl-5-hydroxy-6-metoxy-1,4-benzoquinol methylase